MDENTFRFGDRILKEEPEFRKDDQGKEQLDLLPTRALRTVSRVLAYGTAKYGVDNWKKVEGNRRYTAAALRHIYSFMEQEAVDAETGLPHLAHAVCCLLFILELEGVRQDGKEKPNQGG